MGENRQQSCEERIGAHMDSRTTQFDLYFGDLDNMDEVDVIELALSDVDDFTLTPHEQIIFDSGKEGDTPDDAVVKDEDDDESTFGHEWGKIVERAKEAIQDYRDEGPDDAILAVSTSVVMRIEISTGGPADYLTADLSKARYGWEVDAVTYHFADWFDHAERRVHDGSSLWRLAEYYAESIDPALGG